MGIFRFRRCEFVFCPRPLGPRPSSLEGSSRWRSRGRFGTLYRIPSSSSSTNSICAYPLQENHAALKLGWFRDHGRCGSWSRLLRRPLECCQLEHLTHLSWWLGGWIRLLHLQRSFLRWISVHQLTDFLRRGPLLCRPKQHVPSDYRGPSRSNDPLLMRFACWFLMCVGINRSWILDLIWDPYHGHLWKRGRKLCPNLPLTPSKARISSARCARERHHRTRGPWSERIYCLL